MPKYKVTLKRFKYRSQDGDPDEVVVIYVDKTTVKQAFQFAVNQATEIFEGLPDGESKTFHTVEEVPAS